MHFPTLIDDGIELRPFQLADAPALIDAITRNRHRLDRWMRWTAPIKTEADARALIQQFSDRLGNGQGYHVGLWLRDQSDEQLAGGIACQAIIRETRSTEIGYWLDEAYVGRGLVTRACRLVISDLFHHQGIHRIEIQAVAENAPSRAVAERLGFTFEGIRREAVWITDSFKDHALYSLLEHEWQASEGD